MKETGREKGNLHACLATQSSSTLGQKIRLVALCLKKKKKRIVLKEEEEENHRTRMCLFSVLGMELFCGSPSDPMLPAISLGIYRGSRLPMFRVSWKRVR